MGLKFKGDKPQKKKKSTSRPSSSSHGGGSSSRADPDAHLEGWLPAPSPALLLGPSYLVLPPTDLTPPVCIATNPTTGKVYAHALPAPGASASGSGSGGGSGAAALPASALAGLDADELEALVDAADAGGAASEDAYEPSDVHHVWVCARVLDSNDNVTLRSGAGRFLASDELGRVSAEREARGMQEEWTLEAVEGARDRMSIRSAYGKYLSVDVVAGGKVELRADEDKEGETERWRIMMQGEFVVKAKQQFNERNGIKTKPDAGYTVVTDLAGAEVDAMCVLSFLFLARAARQTRTDSHLSLSPARSKRFHRHGQGSSSVGTADDVRNLKKARKEGRLAEAMLDRRAKLKRCILVLLPLALAFDGLSNLC